MDNQLLEQTLYDCRIGDTYCSTHISRKGCVNHAMRKWRFATVRVHGISVGE